MGRSDGLEWWRARRQGGAAGAQVESFEEGKLISHYVDDPHNSHNVALADIGLSSYLQMLLRDNFIHAGAIPRSCHLP